MDNCYFCHKPVFTDEVQIKLEIRRRFSESPVTVTEAAHPDCLESARLWFIEPEPRSVPVNSTGSGESPDRVVRKVVS